MARHTGEKEGRTIQSVEIAFNIIEILQKRGGAGVSELSGELGHSKSTIHSHLRTLERREFLVRDGDKYRLSLRTLDMARHVRNQIGNYDVIRNEVEGLADETGEIVQFGIEEHNEVTYLYKASGEQAVETASRVGTKQPMYSTSLGKAILAYLPPEHVEDVIAGTTFTAKTTKTITDVETLHEELETIRERGYAIDDEENYVGLRCVSAPVKNDDTVLGAISITGPSSRFTDDRLHGELANQVLRAANVIELNTKFA
mgnify:CR=1 FL=1